MPFTAYYSNRPFGIVFYLLYLFFVMVVLLSLLIAQMSDTFANIQSDADRVSIMIRAKIILTQERNGFAGFVSSFRVVSATAVTATNACLLYRSLGVGFSFVMKLGRIHQV